MVVVSGVLCCCCSVLLLLPVVVDAVSVLLHVCESGYSGGSQSVQ